jgi:hypothetical protein
VRGSRGRSTAQNIRTRVQLNLGGHAITPLFFLEARIVGRDALAGLKGLILDDLGTISASKNAANSRTAVCLPSSHSGGVLYFSTGCQRDSGVL